MTTFIRVLDRKVGAHRRAGDTIAVATIKAMREMWQEKR